jgi:BirA family biotin operon repressor/biotin-[acetyl-CoA-carboxylase] ligase
VRRVRLDVTGSTSDEALRLARQGEPLPLVVTAGRQTEGRGRRGRAWASPPGGVWLSVAWPATGAPGSDAGAAIAVALATAEAIEHALGPGAPRVLIKWPNDLLVGGRKVAGVLAERTDAGGEPLTIFGVGVNADFEAPDLPPDLRRPATTLRDEIGAPVDAGALADALIGGIERALRGIDRVGLGRETLVRVAARLAWIDEAVVVRRGDGSELTGRLLGLDDRGAAVLETAAGRVTIAAGEVEAAGPA